MEHSRDVVWLNNLKEKIHVDQEDGLSIDFDKLRPTSRRCQTDYVQGIWLKNMNKLHERVADAAARIY